MPATFEYFHFAIFLQSLDTRHENCFCDTKWVPNHCIELGVCQPRSTSNNVCVRYKRPGGQLLSLRLSTLCVCARPFWWHLSQRFPATAVASVLNFDSFFWSPQDTVARLFYHCSIDLTCLFTLCTRLACHWCTFHVVINCLKTDFDLDSAFVVIRLALWASLWRLLSSNHKGRTDCRTKQVLRRGRFRFE